MEEFKKREDWLEKSSKAKVKEKTRGIVHGLKLLQDLTPKRVQALCAFVGRNETKLSFEPGAVMTGV